MEMINPFFDASHFIDGGRMYTLCFDGWDGDGNVDEDGNKFWYQVTADDTLHNSASYIAYGFSWYFDKCYEDEYIRADFTDTEIEFVVNFMMELIDEDRRNY